MNRVKSWRSTITFLALWAIGICVAYFCKHFKVASSKYKETCLNIDLIKFYLLLTQMQVKTIFLLVYYDGKVTSRTIIFEDGTRKTLGIILPGKYEFGTGAKEHMEILAGKLNVLLPESETWVCFDEGESFYVPSNSKFKVSAQEVADYCCSYIEE